MLKTILACSERSVLGAFHIRLYLILSLSLLLSCGGGGGGSGDAGTAPARETPTHTIDGYASLGNISSASVSVRGTTGVLSSGLTDSTGRFQLTYPQTYTGPLEVTVSPMASSTWLCDILTG